MTHPALRPEKYTTTLDREIAYHGGTTSMINNLPERLRVFKKQQLTSQQRIKELTRENGRLRQELAFYREKDRSSV